MKKRLLLLMVSTLGVAVLCFVLHWIFVDDIYVHRIENYMVDMYQSVNETIAVSETPEAEILSLSMTEALEIITYTQSGIQRYSTRQRPKPDSFVMHSMPIGQFSPFERITAEQMESIREKGYGTQVNYSEEMDAYFMTLIGRLPDGGYVALYKSMNGVHKGLSFFYHFFILFLILFLFFGVFVFVYLSRHVVNPIVRVSGIAHKMSLLDFSERYDGSMQDEVGDLGKSINMLSDRLEQTITELKEANSELSRDIENKEQAEKSRLAFISAMAHELKTPLSLISGYVEGLHENIAEDESARQYYLDVIAEEATHMDGIVKEMLSLSEIVWGEQPLVIERFSITELVEKVKEKYKLLGEDILYSQAEDIYVLGDSFRIEDVLNNYITNAMHHKEKNTPIKIDVSCSEEKARICVCNDGVGIDENDRDKIWGSFYRTDKARSRAYGGSGLGLAIVKATMFRHGCDCGVYNTESGVCFWFELDLFK